MNAELVQEPDFLIHPRIREYFKNCTSIDDDILEASIIESKGPEQSLVIWKEKNILIDGHRRYAVCKKHSLPYPMEIKSFANIEEVHLWMLTNQLARRNPNDHDQAILISRYIELIKKKKGKLGEAAKIAAKAAGVSTRTAYRASGYVQALESMTDKWQDALANQEIETPRKYVLKISQMDTDKQDLLLEQCKVAGNIDPIVALFDPPKPEPKKIAEEIQKAKEFPKPKAKPKPTVKDLEPPVQEVVPDPKITGDHKKVEKLLDKCEALTADLSRTGGKLFSSDGLGGESRLSPWEKRYNMSINTLAVLLMEIRNANDE